jgi:hypothetical protein
MSCLYNRKALLCILTVMGPKLSRFGGPPHAAYRMPLEGALQASGRGGSRQVKDASVSFVGASAPIVTGTTFIFVRDPY